MVCVETCGVFLSVGYTFKNYPPGFLVGTHLGPPLFAIYTPRPWCFAPTGPIVGQALTRNPRSCPMWNAFFTMFTRAFMTVTKSLDSVEKVLDIGNDYISNSHKSFTRNAAKQAILNTASQHARIQSELEADPKLAAIFESLEAEW